MACLWSVAEIWRAPGGEWQRPYAAVWLAVVVVVGRGGGATGVASPNGGGVPYFTALLKTARLYVAPLRSETRRTALLYTVPLLGSFFALCVVPVRVCAAHPSTRQRPARCSRVLYVLISAYPDLCALWPRGEHPERCSKWGNAARPRGACAECAVEGAHGGHTLKYS